MLLPRRTKFRKMHRGRRRGDTKGQSEVQFGEYGIKALEAGWITNRQIEAARIAMTRKIRRGGKVWINVFPDKSYTKKPAETRMGKGKGSPEGWVAVIKPGLSRGQTTVMFGEYGIKSLDAGWLTNRQIEAARIAMTRKIKRGGKVWINLFPDKPFTKKPAETRMGSGKGSPEGWVAVVKPGRVMFELAGVPEPLAREALRLAGMKLPVRTKIVTAEDNA